MQMDLVQEQATNTVPMARRMVTVTVLGDDAMTVTITDPEADAAVALHADRQEAQALAGALDKALAVMREMREMRRD